MKEIILAKFGEIVLKGLNKNTFEAQLLRNVKRRLKPLGKFDFWKAQSTLYIKPLDEDIDIDGAIDKVKKIFGIAKVARAVAVAKDWNAITQAATDYLEDQLTCANSFKVQAKRADKKFPMGSPEICMQLGGAILEKFPHLTVDVHNPDLVVNVEIREDAFIHAGAEDGAGGIPVGTSGKAMLLLSGGIDSPVAGYMMAKRGVAVSAIHFESPPYTSERARLKVEKLASLMAHYCGAINFHCVPFTEIQEVLRDNAPEELFTILMRRLMMEVAQRICDKEEISALVTGESLGQVASQTMAAMVCTDNACRMPVFRPLIGMDKSEIVAISRKINTFETSIEPYEDCCTVFTPKHPKTRPVLSDVIAAQQAFDYEPLIQKAVENTKIYTLNAF
ncbi:MAG: tRNA 4-thiouridine(8) synthase ThiI [Oscillospiraceae bacterium]|nr:tRNA 4-thiouridine(8) synthase ThiI [Oscillospiraceae bacterium]